MKLRHKHRGRLVDAWLDTELIPPVLYIMVRDAPFPISRLTAASTYHLVEATDVEVLELEQSGYVLDRT